MGSLHDRFIKPTTKDSDSAAREIVLNYLLVGVFLLTIAALLDTLVVFIFIRQHYLVGRIVSVAITALVVAALYRLSRKNGLHLAVSWLLTAFILLAALGVAFQWGVLDSNALLLLALGVVMAGVLISARASLILCGVVAAGLIYLQYAQTHGVIHPDLQWLGTKPTAGDIVGFAAILFIIALVSWLFNRQMEASLARARRSEKALQRQKAKLEITVQKRTQQLEAAQLEQMRELYRFAELGRLSTALFHDLANLLTVVSVDIEGLKRREESESIRRLQQNIHQVEDVIRRVRQQLQGKPSIEAFNVTKEIHEVLDLLEYTADKSEVAFDLDIDGIEPSLLLKGDITRFRQIILNLVTNGIEAYGKPGDDGSTTDRQVVIHLERKGRTLSIEVTDYGAGITLTDMARIFEPFFSTKTKGVGIGLFIVKQVVEQDFGGTIELMNRTDVGTTFRVNLPRSYYARVSRN